MADLQPKPLSAIRPDAAAGVGRPGSAPSPASGAGRPESGVAFRALLERLEARTRELEEQGRTLDDASGLAGALSTARASLEDAVSLGDQLLEAYRESLLQAEARPDRPSPTAKETRP